MRLVFFGTPEFALPSLKLLHESRHQVKLVVSRADKPVGRRQEVTAPPVVELAERLGLPCWQPTSLKAEEAVERLKGAEADVAVVVAYGKLIPAQLLAVPRCGFVNLHPSLLPRHRGPSPIQWALVSGDRVTGVSTMLLDEGMDTGPLLLQERVDIQPWENADELAERLSKAGADLVLKTLDGLEQGTVTPHPQPTDGVSVSPLLRRSFGSVDWSMPARQLVNRLRGLTSWPGLYTELRGGRLKIHQLEEVTPAPTGDESPGTVLSADAAGIVVRCGRGTAARITELQREGRRRLPADAFLVGERVVRGERLG